MKQMNICMSFYCYIDYTENWHAFGILMACCHVKQIFFILQNIPDNICRSDVSTQRQYCIVCLLTVYRGSKSYLTKTFYHLSVSKTIQILN